MKRYLTILLAAAGACGLQAQSTEVKQGYNGIKGNLLKMAEKMPEENYSFKASPDIRSFGQLVGHVADAQMGTCSAVNGEPKKLGASSMTSKADLSAALKTSSLSAPKRGPVSTTFCSTPREVIKLSSWRV